MFTVLVSKTGDLGELKYTTNDKYSTLLSGENVLAPHWLQGHDAERLEIKSSGAV